MAFSLSESWRAWTIDNGKNAQLGFISCTFRQTNIVWVLYAYASSQLMYLRFKRADPGGRLPAKLHDPPALEGGPGVFDSAIGESYL